MTQGHRDGQGRADTQTPHTGSPVDDFQESPSSPSTRDASGRGRDSVRTYMCPSDSDSYSTVATNPEGRDGQGREIPKVIPCAHAGAHAHGESFPKGRPSPSPRPSPLSTWLNTLRERRIDLHATAHGLIQFNGPATDDDHDLVARYRHALTIAATGTHPAWWNTVLGRTAPVPDVELPGTYHDPACACCGAPSPHVDEHLLPWCDRHQPAEGDA